MINSKLKCPQCKKPTVALFYPKHATLSPPRANEYKCCQECLVHTNVAIRTCIDVNEMLTEFRNGG